MMKANDSFEKIMEWILSADTIALAGHLNPDGDAIGACLALGGALEKAGKKVQVILEKYADRLLFATDMVNADMVFPLGAWLDEMVANGKLSREAYEKVIRGNAERIFGL